MYLLCCTLIFLIQVPGLRELIEGILPYTERHFSRIDRLFRSTFLLDYTLSSMSILNPLEAGEQIDSNALNLDEDVGNHSTEIRSEDDADRIDPKTENNPTEDSTGETPKISSKTKNKKRKSSTPLSLLPPLLTLAKKKHKGKN